MQFGKSSVENNKLSIDGEQVIDKYDIIWTAQLHLFLVYVIFWYAIDMQVIDSKISS